MYFRRRCRGKLGYQVFEIWILGPGAGPSDREGPADPKISNHASTSIIAHAYVSFFLYGVPKKTI